MIAEDTKKDLLARFCLAYKGVLKDHNLICTLKTGKKIHSETGLKVSLYLEGANGGVKQIASKVAFNEIDLVIYLKDSLINNGENKIINQKHELDKMCDIYSVPLATNISTAEALILALSRGDLNWRVFVNPEYN